MATTIRVLGQAYPAAGVQTALYTCAATSAVISTLAISNTDGVSDTVTVRIAVGGAADSDMQLLLSGATVSASGLNALTLGLTLATGDVIKVTSTNGACAFQLFGQESS